MSIDVSLNSFSLHTWKMFLTHARVSERARAFASRVFSLSLYLVHNWTKENEKSSTGLNSDGDEGDDCSADGGGGDDDDDDD